jgi:polysaccharide biosynthesis/export protein
MSNRLLVTAMLAALTVAPLAGAQTTPSPPAGPAPQSGAPPTVNPPPVNPPTGNPPTGTTNGTTPSPGTTGVARPDPPRSGGTAAVAADYKLSIGDKLRVEVYKDPQLSQSLQVRPDGKITLPLVGDVSAAGLTSLELRDQLATALREYVTNPVVTVIVVETVPPLVYVMGEVTNPGSIPLNGPMSVLQALAMAGGFREFANTKDIRVLRRSSRGVQTIAFNYKTAVKGEGTPVMLQPGDTVIVP